MSETFDLTAFIEGSNYPQKTVAIYTNVAALQEREYLEELINNSVTSDETAKLEAQQDLVTVMIEQSALNFELQGMPFRIAQKIADVFNEETPATDDQVIDLIVASIRKITNVDGAVTSNPDSEGIKNLQQRLSPGEFKKLIEAVVEINFSAASYEASIDAGFLVGGSDVA